jgi:hypothetical protein
VSVQNIVVIPTSASPSIEDLRRYRRKHGCSLAAACKALGWVGQRIVVADAGRPF